MASVCSFATAYPAEAMVIAFLALCAAFHLGTKRGATLACRATEEERREWLRSQQ